MTPRLSVALLVAVFALSACGGPPASVAAPDGVAFASTAGSTPPSAQARPADFVSADEARNHFGESARVCGKVVSATYAEASSGSPTFLNLDKPYPDHVFTIVVWEEDRASFGGSPEIRFADANVCITGLVKNYQGVAQIVSRGNDIEVSE